MHCVAHILRRLSASFSEGRHGKNQPPFKESLKKLDYAGKLT